MVGNSFTKITPNKNAQVHTNICPLTFETHAVDVGGEKVIGDNFGSPNCVFLLTGSHPLCVVLLDLTQVLEQLAHLSGRRKQEKVDSESSVFYICMRLRRQHTPNDAQKNTIKLGKRIFKARNNLPCWRWGCWKGPGSTHSHPHPGILHSTHASDEHAPTNKHAYECE